MAPEASHISDPILDAAIVLLNVVVHVGAGAVVGHLARYGTDYPG